jgi:protein TonB
MNQLSGTLATAAVSNSKNERTRGDAPMTREKLFGWVSSVALQVLSLGALGVSPLWRYDDLPTPHDAIPMRNYVPVIETPKVPVVSRRAPASAGKALARAPRSTKFTFSPVILAEIPTDADFFPSDANEGFLHALTDDVPGSVRDAPVTTREPGPPKAPLRVSQVTAPRKRRHVNPTFPPFAAASRVEGTVLLEATIDEDGNVVNLIVLRSVPALDQAALEAVGQWKYEPTLLNGTPVPILMSVSVRFDLGR